LNQFSVITLRLYSFKKVHKHGIFKKREKDLHFLMNWSVGTGNRSSLDIILMPVTFMNFIKEMRVCAGDCTPEGI
jgi:hypothetical protein